MKNIKVGTTVILPGHLLVKGMKDRWAAYCLQHMKDGGEALGITSDAFPRILAALYQDTLENYAHWSPSQGSDANYSRLMFEYIPHWGQISDKAQNQLFHEVFQPALDEVVSWVYQLDSDEDRWRIWYVKRLGSDILIEKGPDFRIVDWERRIELGAEYLDQKEEGVDLPEDAWVLDDASRYLIKRHKGFGR